jgi:hypothetical protein
MIARAKLKCFARYIKKTVFNQAKSGKYNTCHYIYGASEMIYIKGYPRGISRQLCITFKSSEIEQK